MYIKKLKIGDVELPNNLILAPMAGITDLPFRSVCKKYGAGSGNKVYEWCNGWQYDHYV